MNNKVVIAVLAALVICVVVVAAFFVLADKKDNGEEKLAFTEEELSAIGITLCDDDTRIVLRDVIRLDGTPFDSSDIPKKYVLLTFWASWCPDCKQESPSLQRLYDERESETFSVLTISLDRSQDALEAYLEKTGYDFPIVFNYKNNIWKEYIPWIPTSFLLSPDGHAIAKIVGNNYTDWDDEKVRQILDYLMSRS